MNFHIKLSHIIVFVFFVLGSIEDLQAEDTVGVSSSSVIHSQLQSIADEVVSQAKLDLKSRVAVLVEGEEPRSLVENAFIEALQKNNYSPVLSAGKIAEQSLQVYLLDVDIRLKKVDEKLTERTIRTNLEARTVTTKEGVLQLIGNFHRESKDTAEVFTSLQVSTSPSVNDNSMMQRLLTPLIVIGGAIMIVYLFFTVRS